jgi:hypothetical protein
MMSTRPLAMFPAILILAACCTTTVADTQKTVFKRKGREPELFDEVAARRQEALTKAAKTMHELGDSRAEKFRAMLREEFPE